MKREHTSVTPLTHRCPVCDRWYSREDRAKVGDEEYCSDWCKKQAEEGQP